MIMFAETSLQDQRTLKDLIDPEFHHTTRFYEESATLQNASQFSDATVLSVFIHSIIDEAFLDCLPHLKAIITRSTGADHINIDACKKRGIIVANVPSYGQNTVAEYAFALILSLSRQIKPMVERLTKGVFCRQGLQGFDLHGKTIGVIGTGKIGSHVVSIARGFGMNVLCHAQHEDPTISALDRVVYLSLEELLRRSDIITLHIPSTPQTYHMINKDNITLLKPSAMLINTARGPVVDIEAIVDELHKGNLKGGVGLDTFESEDIWIEEKYLKNDALSAMQLQKALMAFSILQAPNVILSPHNAYNTGEAMDRILAISVDNLHRYLRTGSMEEECTL